MLNKIRAFLSAHNMVQPGDSVICAVSGGADSVALLFAMYLLRDKLNINLSAAHYNHKLRGEESERDEAFVKEMCDRYDIPLYIGYGEVKAGKKGLEAAAREARYSYLRTLPGKIATAHTADDNCETMLMHLIRGTGLKGLGGITPVNGALIRPMLQITRKEVMYFLESYHLPFVEDSSNATDQFLRNRVRHNLMPFLMAENPRLAENISALALRLREDEAVLCQLAEQLDTDNVPSLREMPSAIRKRVLSNFLYKAGVPEPEAEHISLAEELVFSSSPSAKASFPGNVTIRRCYDRLEAGREAEVLTPIPLPCPGDVQLQNGAIRVICAPADKLLDEGNSFTVDPKGTLFIRSRCTGDQIRLDGGTKSLKKLFIDHKIPAARRNGIPVIADSEGVVAVFGFGVNKDRLAKELPAVTIRFEIQD